MWTRINGMYKFNGKYVCKTKKQSFAYPHFYDPIFSYVQLKKIVIYHYKYLIPRFIGSLCSHSIYL